MKRLAPLLALLLPLAAFAQDEVKPHQRLRDRYGVEVAGRLLRSADSSERLRGVARAAEIAAPLAAGPEVCKSGGPTIPICEEAKRALELLTLTEATRGAESRVLLATARALAPFAVHGAARGALLEIVNGAGSLGRRDADDADAAQRVVLARGTAAMALASARDSRATEALVLIARANGGGQAPAAQALAAEGLSFWTPTMPAPITSLAVQSMVKTGDLRALDLLRIAAKQGDAQTRATALLGLGQLGDGRATELARAAIGEHDARLRAAAAEVFVLLDAGERNRAVEALVNDEVTAPFGVSLAERTQDDGVINALAARAVGTHDHALRRAIVHALGRGTPPRAVAVLEALADRDPTLLSDIAQALARSPSAVAMPMIEKMAQNPQRRRLALRAYVVRRTTREQTSDKLDALIDAAARSSDPKDRAIGLPALLSWGKGDLERALGDADPAVRRASALAALAVDPARAERLLLRKLKDEKDPATSAVFAAALRAGDPEGAITSGELELRATSAQADAPLAALALARRVSDRPGDEGLERKVDALLRSPVPSVRAHAAMGLADSALPSATGKLADLLSFEVNPDARRAAVLALGGREWQSAPIARRALEAAAKLDPDGDVRFAASRILLGLKPPNAALVREVAWLRAATADGGPPPRGLTGTLIPKHGIAIPFAFDDEGYALVPGVPIGEASIALAPRVPGSP